MRGDDRDRARAVAAGGRPALRAARHVVLGDEAAAALRRAGARDVVVLRDLLSVGPCDPDPRRHERARRAFWRAALGRLHPEALRATPPERTLLGAGALAAALRRRPRRPVVVWSAPRWPERLALAWIADAIVPRRAAAPDAAPGGDWLATTPGGAALLDPAALARRVARARPLGPLLPPLRAVWRAYAAETPAALPAALRRASTTFPDLPRVARAHADLFPRAGRRPSLSPLDAFLLRGHAAPASLPALCRRRGARRFLAALGDLVLDVRRHAWLDRGALEVAGDGPRAALRRLRLTARGRALLRGGLPRLGDAPPLFAGGHEIHGPRSWVVRRGRVGPR